MDALNSETHCVELQELGLRSGIALSSSLRRTWATIAIDARSRGDLVVAAQAERQLIRWEVAQTYDKQQLARLLSGKLSE